MRSADNVFVTCAVCVAGRERGTDTSHASSAVEDTASRQHGETSLDSALKLGKRLKRLRPEWERWRAWLADRCPSPNPHPLVARQILN